MATTPNESNAIASNTTIRFDQLSQLSSQKKLGLIFSIAAVIALIAGAWMWSQTPDYRVLYSNISDHDGGAIISALQKMNVPYKFSEGGSTILAPDNQVHEIRLRLASQGLPKGGLAGFELMENQKFGSSQFLEQVNYQRALEGELARSVQSLSAVQSARVHLAISKPSVFARDKQSPSVSVLLNLYPGRVLGPEQVSAIVHLVSSSVPNLPVKNVTVVDQHGNLLSAQNENKSDGGFDAKQLQYIQDLEDNYTKRIEAILTPITGAANVRAQVTADIDFSRIERAEEIYRPNNKESESASIRSQQKVESKSTGSKFDGGIPGALTNRPPEPASAPIEVPGEAEEAAQNTPAAPPTDQRMESTINYEVDKTIQHTSQSIGSIRRLSVAVVINYRKKIDDAGNTQHEPLSPEEITKINNLVKEAMGYKESRGDTLTVTNNLFTIADSENVDEIPFWKDPDMLSLAKEISKQLLIAAIVLYFLLKVLRPFLRNVIQPQPAIPALPPEIPDNEEVLALEQSLDKSENKLEDKSNYEQNLQMAKQLATNEPAVVANVIKNWVSSND